MKSFAERNPIIVGAIGVAVTAAVVMVGIEYKHLFVDTGRTYSAYFADAGALHAGTEVQVSGVEVGEVSGVELKGSKVLISFKVGNDIRLGDHTEAAIQTNTLLGTKIVEVTPRGEGRLSQSIPLERTRPAYQLPDALGDLTTTIGGLNTDQLSEALVTLSKTFEDTPPDLKAAVQGLTRISQTLNTRDQQLRALLTNANKATAVLAKRTDQVVSLIRDTNALLAQLLTESSALDSLANHLSGVSKQLSGLIAENRQQLRPALDKLNGVLAIVDNRKGEVQQSIKLLNSYALSLGESVSSGSFFNAYIGNLLPGQFVQPFIDAAFSDLGLDPHTALPSQLLDPPTGQPATPPLPVPYPRTGQGGEPRRTLPDAITGNQDPNLPAQFPGRYPYREPPPAPPPGGPPPGPPALPPPGLESTTEPTPLPIYVPAPNETGPGGESAAPEPSPGTPTGIGGMP